MRYNLKKSFYDVSNVSAEHSHFAIRTKRGEVLINDEVHPEYDYYSFLGNNLMQYGKDSKHYVVINGVEIETPNVMSLIGLNERQGLYLSKFWYDKIEKKTKSETSLYNFISRFSTVILKDSVGIFLHAYEENSSFIVYFPRTTITSFSILKSEFNWETDLSLHGEIRQTLGIQNNQLLITLDNNELISLDVENGKMLWKIVELQERYLSFQPSYKHFRCLSYNACHLEKEKLYELTGSIYYSIDLNTQAVEILWEDERINGYITVIHRTYTEDYIYFTGSYNSAFQPHLLGVFNRKTLAIEWLEDVNLSVDPALGYVASLNQAPQVSGDKLYVLDSSGLLRIYEKGW